MNESVTANTSRLSLFMFRLDRIRIFLWLTGLNFFTLIVPISFVSLYSSEQERAAMAETMQNPAMTAMVGPADLSNYTLGVMTSHQMLLMTAAVAGLMSILLVTRHTRADEEEGRVELIRSLPVGRLAYLNAALFVISCVCVILAIINGAGLYMLGIESMQLEGSLLYGAALGGTALVFAGITAFFSQLSDNARGTVGLSIGFLLAAYLFRAVTDISNESLSWLSPLGWVTKTEAYGANNWWPVVLMVIFAFVMFAAANYLHAIRDLESGFLPARSGRTHAGSFLQSPFALAFRLQRTGFIAWAIGLFVIGASYGSVLGDMESFFEGNELMEQMLQPEAGLTLTETFIPMLLIVLSLLAAIPPVMSMNKLRGEEKKGRLDHMLGRAVSRNKLMGSYFTLAVVNGFVMLMLAGFGLWAAGNAVMEEGFSFSMVMGAAAAYYPAILVMISLSAAFIGWFPKFLTLVWVYIFYSFIVLYLGGLFQFADWIGELSPFGHVPQYPVEDMAIFPLVVLMLIAAVIAAAGFIGFRKRDIEN
ncbi:ABC transporter permease [Alkalicoccus daliensis]|uniref:ABC-2 type transport system permease protein n=1 Tax=Alkalicoccus daliensis TaxID=745820 RepID=A0A1H0E3C2_9BACI|nr:ABC transporter permease [Alkalicoccus daliensis]SDN76836.1 ABC-2 type transport system permease protein [Alkalicoccus daliensis]